MINLINFLIYSGLCMAIFLLFYMLILKKETCFKFNRIYLLATSLLALILPLLKLPILNAQPLLYNIPTVFTLPEIVVIGYGVPDPQVLESNISSWILPGIYFAGVGILAIKLLLEILKIYSFSRISNETYDPELKIKIVENSSNTATFSFLNKIYWNEDAKLSLSEKRQILLHEKVHVDQKHSLDILFFEIMYIIFWPNLLIRLYKKEIMDVHEFLADSRVVSQLNFSAYANLIARQFIGQSNLNLAHSFSRSNPLKRIKMMEINKKTAFSKMFLTLPLVLLTLFLLACMKESIEPNFIESEALISQKVDLKENTTASEVFTVVEEQPMPVGGYDQYYRKIAREIKYPVEARRAGIEGKVYVQFIVNEDGSLSDIEVIKGIGGGCDEEAVEAIGLSDKWEAGKQRGQNVRVRMVLPISFKLG
jgi:TonB family protein